MHLSSYGLFQQLRPSFHMRLSRSQVVWFEPGLAPSSVATQFILQVS